MNTNVLKDLVGEWITGFVLWPCPTSSEFDRVSSTQSLKIDHEAFWSGCVKPSQLDYIFFTKSVNGLKITLNSRPTGKPQHHSNSWLRLEQKEGCLENRRQKSVLATWTSHALLLGRRSDQSPTGRQHNVFLSLGKCLWLHTFYRLSFFHLF